MKDAASARLSVLAARYGEEVLGVFAPAAGDLSGFVHDHLLGAESYEASYGINFFSAPIA